MATAGLGLPTPGTAPGFSQLDAPPPSPAMETGRSTGLNFGQYAAATAPMGGAVLPPEVLTGILQAGEKCVQTLEAIATVVPQAGPAFLAAKEAVMTAMAQVLQAGGGPTAPQATGPGFPGGGFDQGGMPLASGG